MNKDFWNARFGSDGFYYGSEPNEFLKDQLNIKQPGLILLPGEGEGRNALYAASLGWRVHAVDYSEAGRKKAMAEASRLGYHSFEYTLADVTDVSLGRETYDLVALIYLHLPPQTRPGFHRKCIGALKNGGLVVLEAFSPKQLAYNSGGPKDITMLYSLEMLRDDFKDLDFLFLEEQKIQLAEGENHNGPASVVRMVARKQAT